MGPGRFSKLDNVDSVQIFLGANDFLGRAWSPTDQEFIDAYLDLIKQVRTCRPHATIHCITQCTALVVNTSLCESHDHHILLCRSVVKFHAAHAAAWVGRLAR